MTPAFAHAFDAPTATRPRSASPFPLAHCRFQAGDRRSDRHRPPHPPHNSMRNGEAALDHLTSAIPVTAKSVAGPFAGAEVLATDGPLPPRERRLVSPGMAKANLACGQAPVVYRTPGRNACPKQGSTVPPIFLRPRPLTLGRGPQENRLPHRPLARPLRGPCPGHPPRPCRGPPTGTPPAHEEITPCPSV